MAQTAAQKAAAAKAQAAAKAAAAKTAAAAAAKSNTNSAAKTTTTTTLERNKAQEAEALALGYTQAQIDARGGINSQGYWNDVPLSGQLTAAEQKSVTLPNGTVNTAAMAKILQDKQIAELVSQGTSLVDATSKISAQYGQFGVPLISGAATGGTTSGTTSGITDPVSAERRDAFAAIRKVLLTYGFTETEMKELDTYISGALTNPRIGAEQAVIDMRGLTAYKARFAGNETRVKNGKNALSEADYLAQEDSYLQYLKAGGVETLGTRALYADLIAGAVAPTEVGKRINIAVDRVQKADPEIKKQLQAFYPNITDADLVSYFLAPAQSLVDLERKATAAEIGAAAAGKGFNAGKTADEIALYKKSAEDLAAYGIDRAGALQGYANVAEVLPASEQLSNIYASQGIKYNQASAEAEFFKGDTKAIEERKRLKSLERAAFSGESGVDKNSLNGIITGSF